MKVEMVKDGEEIVECPGCGRSRAASPGYYICSQCGAEFTVSED